MFSTDKGSDIKYKRIPEFEESTKDGNADAKKDEDRILKTDIYFAADDAGENSNERIEQAPSSESIRDLGRQQRIKDEAKDGGSLNIEIVLFLTFCYLNGFALINTPNIMRYTGWGGVGVIVFTAIVSAYTTNIVLRDFLAIRRNEPQTYLSYSALCNKSRHCQAVLLTIVFHLYLLLTLITALQEIVHTLQDLTNAHKQLRLATKAQENQIGTATIGILLFPLTLLRSPKRYTWLVLVCMAGCVIGGLLLTNLLGNLKRSDQVYDSKPIDEIQVLVYISAGICNLIRAYGIHPILSLAINDMRDPEEAPRVIAIGFAVPTIFVVIVSMMSFLTFGGGIPPILFTAIDKAMTGNPSLFFHVSTTAVKSLLCFQLCFVYVLVMNTLNLCFEQSVLTTENNCHRFLMRASTTTLVIVFTVAASHLAFSLIFVNTLLACFLCILYPLLAAIDSSSSNAFHYVFHGIVIFIVSTCMIALSYGILINGKLELLGTQSS